MKPRSSRQRVWLAAILTIVMPGLGHIFLGQLKKGLFIYAFMILLSFGLFSAVLIRPLIPFNFFFVALLLIAIYIFWIVEAVKSAKTLGDKDILKPFNRWHYYVAMWALSTFIVIPVIGNLHKSYLVEAYIVPTGGMETTILKGDFIIGDRRRHTAREVEQGNVIVFKYPHNPKEKYVKRLVAGPGQTIRIINREIIVDGEPFNEPEHIQFLESKPRPKEFIDPNIFPSGNGNQDNYGLIRVPAKGDTLSAPDKRAILWYVATMDGHDVRTSNYQIIIDGNHVTYYTAEQDYYFAIGDNRDKSFDSRYWGFVPKRNILGEALFVYFSLDIERFPFLTTERLKRIGRVIR